MTLSVDEDVTLIREALDAAVGAVLVTSSPERGEAMRQAAIELVIATRSFITKARDQYGLGRFMPDELPLLNEMARLCEAIDQLAASEDRRAELEAARLARRHVVSRGTIGFTHKPTPPSGPPPEGTGRGTRTAPRGRCVTATRGESLSRFPHGRSFGFAQDLSAAGAKVVRMAAQARLAQGCRQVVHRFVPRLVRGLLRTVEPLLPCFAIDGHPVTVALRLGRRDSAEKVMGVERRAGCCLHFRGHLEPPALGTVTRPLNHACQVGASS